MYFRRDQLTIDAFPPILTAVSSAAFPRNNTCSFLNWKEIFENSSFSEYTICIVEYNHRHWYQSFNNPSIVVRVSF